MIDIARIAASALLAELATTPKPGLVDLEHRGAHRDLCYDSLEASALTLEASFAAIARSARGALPSLAFREEIGELGRRGEAAMLRASGGSNTHRGALWAVGLLVAATASLGPAERRANQIAARAAQFARLPDRFSRRDGTHGSHAARRYGAGGAAAQAANGFPAVMHVALPLLNRDIPAPDVLLALMAAVDDTCVLHRGGLAGRQLARIGVQAVLRAGGTRTNDGLRRLRTLDARFVQRNISPGGSADLLAAAFFLRSVGTATFTDPLNTSRVDCESASG